ncbi:MAG: DUF1641 domain-containing protein [Thermoproteus sp. AZ2]|uniref:DUF1641 domain-containing protein n=1 Tax=Thermoproteus sp. AZ2 TaxID=1609232 RepID=A0ACC6UZ40_9CREN|nr:MAG: hypothetical protein TU35_01690 [Thermoproteus sp. AZ2]
MSEVVTIPKAEYERLLNEVAELRRRIEELDDALFPIKYLLEKLPNLMADIQMFKVAAPLISMLSVMDGVDLNAMGAGMAGGMNCASKALREIAENGAPKIGLWGLLGALSDPQVQKGMGIMITLLKHLGGCMEDSLKQVSEKQ